MFNSALMVCPRGSLVGHHRKRVLTDEEIAAGITSGGSVTDVTDLMDVTDVTDVTDGASEGSPPCSPPLPWLGGRRVGILICADVEVSDL